MRATVRTKVLSGRPERKIAMVSGRQQACKSPERLLQASCTLQVVQTQAQPHQVANLSKSENTQYFVRLGGDVRG